MPPRKDSASALPIVLTEIGPKPEPRTAVAADGSVTFYPESYATAEQWERWKEADGVCLEKTPQGYCLTIHSTFDAGTITPITPDGAPIAGAPEMTITTGSMVEQLWFRQTADCAGLLAVVMRMIGFGRRAYCRTPELHKELTAIFSRLTITADDGQHPGSELIEDIEAGPAPWPAPKGAISEPPIPRPPDAFPEGIGKIPNNPAVAAMIGAIHHGGKGALKKAGGWVMPKGAYRPVYEHSGNRGGKITVYVSPVVGPYDPTPSEEMLLEMVESLDPFHADILLAMLAQLCEPTTGDRPKHPMLEPVLITTESIARYKGIQRRGNDRRLLLKEIHDRVEDLRQIYFDVQAIRAHDPDKGGKYRACSWEGDKILDIVRVRELQMTFDGNAEEVAVAWEVRAGQWAAAWYSPESRVYIGRMARAFLELPHAGRGARALAKKLGQRFLLLRDSMENPPRPFVIENLLRLIGELPMPEARTTNWANRTRQELEEALTAFEEAGILAPAVWSEGYGPDDTYRGRGWVAKWLAAHGGIALAGEAPRLEPMPRGRRRMTATSARRDVDARGIEPAELREVREQWGWTQDALAQDLGISRKHLSGIESGKKLPSLALAYRIREWIGATKKALADRE